ncbi:MAG: stringent starvation protein A [Zetaproteobacteria bacterium CG12_big_fil_rev_8_21_14_0_65_55_1124]|nr:MAG: stringent starvation protein A [Zetaproteobacteria bacterium CG1_02_55_237]PIS19722.1 MAG: stringent starvation protein A [Zetaproteobacteria bacterium CG08_land_8_20_14_0_20_55_17]PIW43488.1 MAG: stringent starvation protein A [Zetaproteobacteria bacterium CG12_big_fil_rev_8_21_14_0_65_55_1124]PIY54120.1 MAG: stringent starvation protein A [Zetaproteobacteria bacterium CG_4_10_14_0_8_um_filter_55_43]PIZ39113.1 MAG: stringent starvation protein A [Zetaproteobacteria bacterium CG_4_10_14
MIKLYSDPASPDSHRTRIVLAEKELPSEIIDVEDDESSKALQDINPVGKLPTLEDRSTVLFEASVVNEYLDERYPHPPLKPGSPAERAQMRLAVMRIEQELFPIYDELEKASDKAAGRKKIGDYLEALDTYMARQEYFVGECYTLADVSLAPILWRLSPMGIDTARWPHLEAYMDRLFERPAFERSLSEHEQMMHD